MKKSDFPLPLLGALVLLLAGCVGIPPDALKLGPDSAANRDLQTRAFRARNEPEVLAACAAVLQDLGFSLDESETKLGVLVGSKEFSAINPLEVGGQVLSKILSLGISDFIYTKRQVIRASLVLRPGSLAAADSIAAPGSSAVASVRVTFQRRIYQNTGLVLRSEQLNDPKLYQEFFARLSKSVFLETQVL